MIQYETSTYIVGKRAKWQTLKTSLFNEIEARHNADTHSKLANSRSRKQPHSESLSTERWLDDDGVRERDKPN